MSNITVKESKHKNTSKTLDTLDSIGKKNEVAIMEKAVDLALKGDMAAIKFVLDRSSPSRKGARMVIPLPKIEKAKDLIKAQNVVTELLASGTISASEALDISQILEANNRMFDLHELTEMVKELQAHIQKNDPTFVPFEI